MLPEKFFLLLETLRSRSCADGSQRGISTARHVPMELPNAQQRPAEAIKNAAERARRLP
jgi:hypothetical protein